MTRLLASTAILLAAAGPLAAQTAASPFSQVQAEGDFYASILMGQRLYAVDEAVIGDGPLGIETRADWEDVGEIEDLLIAPDGRVKAVILDIGGFLGIGARSIAVDMAALNVIAEDGDPNEPLVVIAASEATLGAAPLFERPDLRGGITQVEPRDPAAVEVIEALEPATGTTAETNNEAMIAVEPETEVAPVMGPVDGALRLTRPMGVRPGYAEAGPETLTPEALIGVEVYGLGEEEIGEISELLADAQGALAGAVVDVGGFLGIGEHTVAVGLDEMQIVRDPDGGAFRVYIEASREKLERRPIYAD